METSIATDKKQQKIEILALVDKAIDNAKVEIAAAAVRYQEWIVPLNNIKPAFSWFRKPKPVYTIEQARIDYSEEWFTTRFAAPKMTAIRLGNIRSLVRKSIDLPDSTLTINIDDYSHIQQWLQHPEHTYKQYVTDGGRYQENYIGF